MTEASKASSIEVVNKAYKFLQSAEPQGFRDGKTNAYRESNLEPAIHEVSETVKYARGDKEAQLDPLAREEDGLGDQVIGRVAWAEHKAGDSGRDCRFKSGLGEIC